MSDPLFDAADDAAKPLQAEEREQLIPTYIISRAELNEIEHIGVSDADRWVFSRKRGDVLDTNFLLTLHRRMFREVWRWAGELRTTGRNIGVDPIQIGVQLRQLTDDVQYWIDNATFSPDEIVARFHHKLVWIHPFQNGNGRHARLAADLLAVRLGRPRFTWGSANLVVPAQTRRLYVEALRAADKHDIAPLLTFVRS
ncbi:mobile mystery protein B [Caulobacter sp. DWR1-3-2b1]|uniref:mobile mystery protein B n=1 Tax=Caulobacter sp. DWR1-3-2b1 TaxID=2804670 RepID=UPI003CFACBAD